MNLESIKVKLKVGVYITLSIIVAIIIVRVLLKLLGANEVSQFAVFWYDLSYYFVSVFEGIYPVIAPDASNLIFETHSVVAVIVYTLLAGILSKSLTSISATSAINRVKEVLDVIFKVIEFFLGFRFLLKLTGASESADFVQFIYSASNIVYKPFTGLLPTYEFGGDSTFLLEISTLIAIVVVIIFDVLSDILISTIKKASLSTPASAKKPETTLPANEQKLADPVAPPPNVNAYNSPQSQAYPNGMNGNYQNPNPYSSNQPNYQSVPPMYNNSPLPQGQSFNFNIGQAPANPSPLNSEQPSYVDQRSINVYPSEAASDKSDSFTELPSDKSNSMLGDNKTPQLPSESASVN
jgi:hypothetical protein